MFISDNTGAALKSCEKYLAGTMFAALFGGVYEIFSHEVYSFYMIYAFAIPLVLGVLPTLILGTRRLRTASAAAPQFYGGGVLTVTLACVFRGVLEIAGTTNQKLVFLLLLGLAMLLAALLCAALGGRKGASA